MGVRVESEPRLGVGVSQLQVWGTLEEVREGVKAQVEGVGPGHAPEVGVMVMRAWHREQATGGHPCRLPGAWGQEGST